MFDRKESEGTKRRHQVDTVVEGMSVIQFVFPDVSASPWIQRYQSHDK